MQTAFESPTANRTNCQPHGFSLVEVTLAIAIVAIGIVGILALFPLGMDATRKAADDTQMMAIGQDWIAYYQQMSANSNYYALFGTSIDSTNVIDPALENYINIHLFVDKIWYRVDAVVTNAGINLTMSGTPAIVPVIYGLGFPTITDPNGLTNMISRVQITVSRTTGPPTYLPMTNAAYNTTHYYFTEVTRYVQ